MKKTKKNPLNKALHRTAHKLPKLHGLATINLVAASTYCACAPSGERWRSIQIQSGVAALRAFPPHSKGDPPGHRPGLQSPIREIRAIRSFGCWAVGLFPAYPLCPSVV